MNKNNKIKISKILKTSFLLGFVLAGFFGFGNLPRALATDCNIKINFSVTPAQVALDQSITIGGWVQSTQYNSKGSTTLGLGDGYCNAGTLGTAVAGLEVFVTDNQSNFNAIINPSYNPLTQISQLFGSFSQNFNNGTYGDTSKITLNQYDNTTQYPIGPYTFNLNVSNFGTTSFLYYHPPGSSDTFYAAVIGYTAAGGAVVLTQASPVTIQVKNQTFACLASNGLYACSPGPRSDLSDVPNNACVGKSAVVIDVSQCGQGAQIYACAAGDGTYACSPGNKSDLSDVPNGACQGKTPVQIASNQCGQAAPSGSTGATSTSAVTGTSANSATTLYNPIQTTDNLTSLLINIMRGFFVVIAAWAVAFIVIGGFQMVIAAGNEEMYTKAKKTIVWAILGLAVAVLSFAIIAIVENLIGAKIQAPPTSMLNLIAFL